MKIKTIITLGIVLYGSVAWAKHHKQTISLQVITKGNHQQTAKNAVCFTSSDFFDGSHCGNSKNNYNWGPKNWRLFPRTDLHDYTDSRRLTIADGSCQGFMKNYHRTSDEKGELFISIEVEHVHETSKNGTQLDINYVRNCQTQWFATK